jgi:hypothetical protein
MTNRQNIQEQSEPGRTAAGGIGAKVWGDFFETMRSINVPDDYMGKRPMNLPPHERELFV